LIEAATYRWHGHYEGDGQPYKPDAEAEAWRERDPLALAEAALLSEGVATPAELDGVRAAAESRVAVAVERARAAPIPAGPEAFEHVFAS
jgi:pyruvate dehydrogenase E1 component alpha subunit